MTTDRILDQRIRRLLHEALDGEAGPHPTWAGSPAAERVAHLGGASRGRWPLRLLAVAAVVGTATGALLLGGGLAPKPSPSLATSAPIANGWIAFTTAQGTDAAQDDDIWFVSLDQPPRRVVGTDSDSVDQLCPAISPDGRELAYAIVDRGLSSLAIAEIRADGSVAEPRTLAVGAEKPAPCPLWSPDGSRIAFAVDRTSPVNPETSGAGSEVHVVTAADMHTTVLPDLLATDLEWSPDGRTLAVVSGEADLALIEIRNERIHLFDVASGTDRTLEAANSGRLSWSPDGTRIAVDASGELQVVDLASGRSTVLDARDSSLHGIGPVWAPNRDSILYQRQDGGFENSFIVVIPAEPAPGTTPEPYRLIPPPAALTLTPTLSAADGGGRLQPYWTTWSPDGRYLLVRGWITRDPAQMAPGQLRSVLAIVPASGDGQVSVLADALALGIVPMEGLGDSVYVPTQTWGRVPDGALPVSPPAASATAAPAPTAAPSPQAGHDLFASTSNGITMDIPAGWTVRPATQSWDGGPFDASSPAADVISDPGDRVHLLIASSPYPAGGIDAWRESVFGWVCGSARGPLDTWDVDGVEANAMSCNGALAPVLLYGPGRGKAIWLVVSTDDPSLAATYNLDWLKPYLETAHLSRG